MGEEVFEITVDGQKSTTTAGETILSACRRLGKDIPTLCHHEALKPYASCRVCLVEAKTERGGTLVASCQYPVSEGLVVETDSPAVREARKIVLELLLARCPASEVVRDLAARYGVTSTPYPTDDPEEKCILCGLCVRACEELVRAAAVGFADRGLERRVGSPFEESAEECLGCGACVNVCPTGKVEAKYVDGVLRMETWRTDLEMAKCRRCGKAFTTQRLLERVAKEEPELAEEIRLCPSCRSKETIHKWAEAIRLAFGAGLPS